MVARYSDSTQSDAPGYTGHVEDDDLGLVYMQQRYYDANIGRFYSNDPVGFKASNPTLFNRYAYANNNPYKYVDPDGAEPIPFSRAELADTRALSSGQIGRGQFASRAAARSVAAGVTLRATPTGRALSLARMVIGAVFNESGEDKARDRITGLLGSNPKGEDLQSAPEDGWEWKGNPSSPVGSSEGAWVNPESGEQIHNDLDTHESGTKRGPHVTYTDKDGKRWDFFPDEDKIERQ
ncbi:RHS repeat-associated core domain-containing protein [Pseudidiomarina terrestris]|uniref:RHS repeat-associated core domain-containing protein n=1 Tax=Pseudidiomarina terrestris TaxID=2820060 RepID=UPI00264E3DD4|nr:MULTISPECIES: RHS repeat-associated core domain-containing protein [unclassified Pseudidiomarina]MDN7127091.1 hypothetical protein [Pseudidiomarina sp. 1APR75-33.1]MDN7135492.1 hypothetical protein [Pseudidiomarina sp. 1ASP75-5]